MPLPPLLERFARRDRLALSRLLTLASRGEARRGRPAEWPPAAPARVVALTGAGGVGKSSLTGKLIEAIRRDGSTVAVLACDPQSPLSGGACSAIASACRRGRTTTASSSAAWPPPADRGRWRDTCPPSFACWRRSASTSC